MGREHKKPFPLLKIISSTNFSALNQCSILNYDFPKKMTFWQRFKMTLCQPPKKQRLYWRPLSRATTCWGLTRAYQDRYGHTFFGTLRGAIFLPVVSRFFLLNNILY